MEVRLVSKTEINFNYFQKEIKKLLDRDVINYSEAKDILDDNISSEQLIIYIARVSSSRDNKLNDYERLIKYLIENAHWSPFEHVYMTIEMTTSRAIGRQELRHRSKTFQEFSQRYAEATEFEDFELREEPDKNRQSSENVITTARPSDHRDENTRELLEDINTLLGLHEGRVRGEISPMGLSALFAKQVELSRRVYEAGLSEGVASECARFVLPECTQTVLYSTGNIRSWIHWLELRDDEHAQKEIREIAQEVGKIFQNQYPVISKALNFSYE